MNVNEPLAYRMSPKTLDDYVGQEHILGKDKILYRTIKADRLSSIILCAVFPPIPGSFFNELTSLVITASANFDGVILDNIAIADFAPIPPTDINNSNICNSSFVQNPNKLISSSLIFK